MLNFHDNIHVNFWISYLKNKTLIIVIINNKRKKMKEKAKKCD